MAAPDFSCRRMSGTCVERGGFWKEDNRPGGAVNTMKYRNFDPHNNQPITALELLQKLEENADLEADIINITEVITKKGQSTSSERAQDDGSRKDRDITARMLDKYSKIAKSINTKSIKRQHTNSSSLSTSTSTSTEELKIAEYDEYLSSRYPQAGADAKQKLSLELTKHIRELLKNKE